MSACPGKIAAPCERQGFIDEEQAASIGGVRDKLPPHPLRFLFPLRFLLTRKDTDGVHIRTRTPRHVQQFFDPAVETMASSCHEQSTVKRLPVEICFERLEHPKKTKIKIRRRREM